MQRYVSEPYFECGAWWRVGRTGQVRLWDQLDTSRIYTGRRDPFCTMCRDRDVSHSQRYHLEAVLLGRRRAICIPNRLHLVHFD